jgi:hypothetical protein
MSGVLQRSTIKIIEKLALTSSKIVPPQKFLCVSAPLRDKSLSYLQKKSLFTAGNLNLRGLWRLNYRR